MVQHGMDDVFSAPAMASSIGEHQGDILAENILAKGQDSTHSAGTARVGKDGIEIAWAPWAMDRHGSRARWPQIP